MLHSDKTVAPPDISMLKLALIVINLSLLVLFFGNFSESLFEPNRGHACTCHFSKGAQKRACLLVFESNEQLSPILCSFPAI